MPGYSWVEERDHGIDLNKLRRRLEEGESVQVVAESFNTSKDSKRFRRALNKVKKDE